MDLQPRPDDHEAKMARADLFKLAQYSFKLFKMIHEDMELEGWVQAKITKSADYIASVYHYMEYEMKFSEYGEKLENSDVYSAMSESQRRALNSMLTEAKATMKKLNAAQAKKLKKKDKVEEGFPTVDDARKRHEQEKGTGKFDKKEVGDGRTQYTRKSSTFTDGGDDSDVKKAKKKAKQTDEAMRPGRGVEEGAEFGSRGAEALALKVFKQNPNLSTSGRADELQDAGWAILAQQYGKKKANYYFNYSEDFPSDFVSSYGWLQDQEQGVAEGVMDTVKSAAKKVASGVNKMVGHGSDEEMRKDLQRKVGVPATGKKPAPVKEASKKKAAKDYDGDGKVESPKDEVWGSRAKAAAKSGKPFKESSKPDFLDLDKDGNKKEPMKKAAEAKCNHTPEGKKCPVHGLKECGGMYEGSTGDYSAKKAAAGKDIGKPGKNFSKIAAKSGGGEKGKRIAGAVLAKLRKG